MGNGAAARRRAHRSGTVALADLYRERLAASLSRAAKADASVNGWSRAGFMS